MNEIQSKTFLVTGATGLIGQTVIKKIISEGGHVIAAVRDQSKADKTFENLSGIVFLCSDITEIPIKQMDVDYIIHGAVNTSSKAFINDPVGIAYTAFEGTRRVLELARLSNVKSLVFLSSMEVYGTPQTDDKIDELYGTNLNTMQVRSVYPVSKRMCESLCASYYAQYNVPAKVVRLTQTFGPGVRYDDGRVFAEFARCAIEGRDIILHTKGETRRSYLYTEDAASAILKVLLMGESGEAYNAANEETYCSIFEMANLVTDKFGAGKTNVIVEAKDDVSSFGYANTLHMNLDTQKLRSLGWEPQVDLQTMFAKMIDSMKKVNFEG